MVFADLFFIYLFLPLFILFYLRFDKNTVLCIFSLFFYAFGEPVYILLLLISVYINYRVGILISRYKSKYHKKNFLLLGIIYNILIIIVFKYLNFITFLLFSNNLFFLKTSIRLPIGISFFTFQSITYIVDVYRKEANCQKNYKNLLLYISMFPQLIAGPIVRYKTIDEEINNRTVDLDDLIDGIYRFIIGLGKKVIIANQLSIISTQILDGNLVNLSKFGAILGMVCFILQLYFDFSGYSDMAIGMGRCMGFHFEENFNYPFISTTMTEFWRRWHISLGTFFRDYVYIPLGGNKSHQFINILVVWFLTGIWHGASMNFLLWGIFLAIIILIEKLFLYKLLNKIHNIFGHIYIIIITIISFSFFYYVDIEKLKMFFNIFISNNSLFDIISNNIFINNIFLIFISIVLSTPLLKNVLNKMKKYNLFNIKTYYNNISLVFHIIVLLISTLMLIGNTTNPFLYTRF